MQSSTEVVELVEEPGVIGDEIVEREVETVRVRQYVDGAAVEAITGAEDLTADPRADYMRTLPERLRALGFVARASVQVLLGIRFLLLASGANTNSGFAAFTLHLSWPFAGPFANVFNSPSFGPGVLEISTLVAMAVYFLFFALLGTLLTALLPRVSVARAFNTAGAQRAWRTMRAATPSPELSELPPSVERLPQPRPIAAKDPVRPRRRFRLRRRTS